MLQFSVSKSVALGVSEILQTYPGATDSHFIRGVNHFSNGLSKVGIYSSYKFGHLGALVLN